MDIVRPLKIEEATSGTEVDLAPIEVDPSEDYIAANGFSLEGSASHYIKKTGDEIDFVDPVIGSATPTYLRNFQRVAIILNANGTLANGDWVGFDQLLSNKRLFLPIKSRLTELVVTNSSSSLAPIGLELYVGTQNAGDLKYTWNLDTTQRTNGYGAHEIASIVDVPFGTPFFLKFTKGTGTTLSDATFIISGQRRP